VSVPTAQVSFLRIPISLPCPVPVLPGTPTTMDEEGEPIPVAERTEKCAVDAWWMIGAQVTCDVHLREACGLLDLDFDGIVEEATCGRGLNMRELQPWGERHRYAQDDPALKTAETGA